MDTKEIDRVKGVGAIFVILGHSFTIAIREEYKLADILFNTIYSFHMPLFFLISGYLYSVPSNQSIFSFLKKKYIRLMLPYYFSILSNEIIKTYVLGKGVNWELIIKEVFLFIGNGWFLSTMFVMILGYTIMRKVIPKRNLAFFVLVLCAFLWLGKWFDMSYFRADRVIIYLPYFLTGIWLKDKDIKKKKWMFSLSIGIFLLGNIGGIGLYCTPKCTFTNYVIALSGIYSVYYMVRKWKNKAVEFMGKNSMVALTVPGFFIADFSLVIGKSFGFLGGWQIQVVVAFMIQLITTFYITKYVLAKNKILALLYGCKYEF